MHPSVDRQPKSAARAIRLPSKLLLVSWFALAASGLTAAQEADGAAKELLGAWRLVEFVGGDDTRLAPSDRSKYEIRFDRDGSVVVRLDCNRGRGAWTSSAAGRLTLGPLALTRAMCPDMTVHDRVARDWSSVASYVLRDGRLFLSLAADGGAYEFEPVAP